MKKVGLVLVAAAFVQGAYLLVLDERQVDWAPFLVVLAIGAVGIALVRRADYLHVRQEERQSTDIDSLRSSLSRVVEAIEHLEAEKDTVNVYDFRTRIDDGFRSDLEAFADAREVLSHLYGLRAYADVMGRFAAGERYLNRVWSASTDGYVDEVLAYVGRAREQFIDAKERLEALVSDGPV